MDTPDVVIAGAGIIGLSTALELAAAGLRVTVIERGRAMAESSWAAAGMLAASDPDNPACLDELSALSVRLYPEYLRRIEQLSGLRVPIRTTVVVQGSTVGKRFETKEVPGATTMPSGLPALSQMELHAIIPQLVTSDREFKLIEESSLDPRDLCAALPPAAVKAGVRLIEHTLVTSSASSNGAEVEIVTSRGTIFAGNFLNCCGAWSGQVLSAERGAARRTQPPAIEPKKGQILAVRLAEEDALTCVLRTPEIYLVPRGDGCVVIGATVEDAGFDKQVHPDAVRGLLERAAALWPPISRAAVVACWAGLRPAAPDGLPIIGNAIGNIGNAGERPDACKTEVCGAGSGAIASKGRPEDHHQWLATGHLRNGILLAPATAHIISQLLRGAPPDIDVRPFRPDRAWPEREAPDRVPADRSGGNGTGDHARGNKAGGK